MLLLLLFLLFFPVTVKCATQSYRLLPGFNGSQMDWIDYNGFFLFSNSSKLALGFVALNPTSFILSVVHRPTSTVLWSANRESPVSASDKFVFSPDGNAYLLSGTTTVWSTNTSSTSAVIQLLDNANLVLLGDSISSPPLWQSFSHPTDTLLSGQVFTLGMSLNTAPDSNNLSYRLQIDGPAEDMLLYADFRPPQPYWSLQQEKLKIINKVAGGLHSAALLSNSWNFYDQNNSLLSQIVIADDSSADPQLLLRSAVLGGDGFISFYTLKDEATAHVSSVQIPQDPCAAPEACDPYYICYTGKRCQCPALLSSSPDCNPHIRSPSPCASNETFELSQINEGVQYFATSFLSPSLKSDVKGCMDACLRNCSCLALFYQENSGGCFLFSDIGSLQQSPANSTGYSAYIKVPSNGFGPSSRHSHSSNGGRKNYPIILVISLTTAVVIAALLCVAYRFRKRRRLPHDIPQSQPSSEEDSFLESIAGMPIRFNYRELQEATDNFSVKLGEGGFGSVYLGRLPDGSQVAVKKLEGIGQGVKEFRAEVATIGSIHHVHLVRLRGFCAQGTHRLLAYEYMAKGSLDKWIFRTQDEGFQLDWEKRYNIALATAKGLAYLHEDCDAKIVHCDIKPENVLLDENFVAKVSDFGLAKLMTREQSHVFTTLRGTRGYLAPEWITNYAISEKSDVYSFGMVLLEIVGGRKNYDPGKSSEKAYFPSYAFKKMEEGNLKQVYDARLEFDHEDERMELAVKVALWCIQEDMSFRPSMAKVVQMLEGVMYVPQPPISSQVGFRSYANFFKSTSEAGTSSGPSDCNSDAYLSAMRLSGPR